MQKWGTVGISARSYDFPGCFGQTVASIEGFPEIGLGGSTKGGLADEAPIDVSVIIVDFYYEAALVIVDSFGLQVVGHCRPLIPFVSVAWIFIERVFPTCHRLMGISQSVLYCDSLHPVGTYCFIIGA